MTYMLEILPSLLDGVKMTLSIFGLTIIGAIPLGMILAVGLTYQPKRWLGKLGHDLLSGYVWIFRGTPLLLQLIFVFYGLPILHIVFDRYSAALVAFILNYAAYFAEIFRGGFLAIDNGQFEASALLNMTRMQTLRYVVMPQVVKIVLPSVGNEVINLVKDSSLVYVIGLGDLLRAGNIASARDVTLVPLVMVGLIYLLLTLGLTVLLKRLEKAFAYYR
ncbi:amino acid ABC transporter permease [Lacticaseibacillus saniviri]|nr:amino acid ABC transporter permease [Lacticaseibacillus saniviri]MCG4281399.1 amino acid ABC transporter permease [Lacticaseibacillus saniviri]